MVRVDTEWTQSGHRVDTEWTQVKFLSQQYSYVLLRLAYAAQLPICPPQKQVNCRLLMCTAGAQHRFGLHPDSRIREGNDRIRTFGVVSFSSRRHSKASCSTILGYEQLSARASTLHWPESCFEYLPGIVPDSAALPPFCTGPVDSAAALPLHAPIHGASPHSCRLHAAPAKHQAETIHQNNPSCPETGELESLIE